MAYEPLSVIQHQILFIYTYIFNQNFKTNIKVGKIFYQQDFICLHKINQF